MSHFWLSIFEDEKRKELLEMEYRYVTHGLGCALLTRCGDYTLAHSYDCALLTHCCRCALTLFCEMEYRYVTHGLGCALLT